MRLLLLAAALDSRVEIPGYELAGKGDFRVLEPVLTEYGNGMDDDTLIKCGAMIEWLYAQVERRSVRLNHYARLGKAPENKVTPELAGLQGSGLHPLMVFIDEAQELFTSPHGKTAGSTSPSGFVRATVGSAKTSPATGLPSPLMADAWPAPAPGSSLHRSRGGTYPP